MIQMIISPSIRLMLALVLKQLLMELRSSWKINETQEYQFKADALQFLATLCALIEEKSPVRVWGAVTAKIQTLLFFKMVPCIL